MYEVLLLCANRMVSLPLEINV